MNLNLIYTNPYDRVIRAATFGKTQWIDEGPVSGQPGKIDPATFLCPSACIYKNALYMLYLGVNTDNIYTAWFDGTSWQGNKRISDQGSGIDPKSNYTPNAAVHNDTLYTVYKGAHSNDLFMASYDGSNWKGNARIGLQSNYNPVPIVYRGTLYIAFKDAHSNSIGLASFNGSGWQTVSVSGASPQSNYTPAAAVFNDKLYLICKHPHNNTMSAIWFDGSAWHDGGRLTVGGNVVPESDAPPNACIFNHNLHIVYKGAHTTAVYEAWFDGTQWYGNRKIVTSSGSEINAIMAPAIVSSETSPAKSAWMKDLSDDLHIGNINIAGSHDAAAINRDAITFYACHSHSITEQLANGIRLLDVRIKVNKTTTGFSFDTCHGDKGLGTRQNVYQSLPSLLDECKTFLRDHPTEMLVMSIDIDDWKEIKINSDRPLALQALANLLSMYPMFTDKQMPRLGQVRAKIVLYNRINEDLALGIPLHWQSNTEGANATASSSRSYDIYVQDRYKDLPFSAGQKKLELVTAAFREKKAANLVWNFASATSFSVTGVYIMKDLLNYFGKDDRPQRPAHFGWILFDYSLTKYHTNTYGYLDIVTLIIASNSGYKGFTQKFHA